MSDAAGADGAAKGEDVATAAGGPSTDTTAAGEAKSGGENAPGEDAPEKTKEDPLAAALAPFKEWLEPIPGDSPGGEDAKYESNYELLRAEVGKLDSPRGEEIDWKLVLREGEDILCHKAKDLLICANAAYAMWELNGIDGLTSGLALYAAFIDQFWDTGFPPKKRIRGRVGALVWYLERVNVVLPQLRLEAKDRPKAEQLQSCGARLKEVVVEKFDDKAPALGPLHDNIERVLIGLPKEKPKPKPKPEPQKTAPAPAAKPAASAADGEAPPAPEAEAPANVPAAGLPAVPSASLGTPEDLSTYLRDVGMSLLDAGKKLRKAQPTSPVAYRLVRLGMWLRMTDPPPLQTDGRTLIPALGEGMHTKLNAMAQAQNWAQLLDEAESALLNNRVNLDLQRYAAQALGGLGAPHSQARQVVLSELRGLLERLPTLPRLVCKDGSLLADQTTKEWLAEEVMSKPGKSGSGGGSGAAPVIPDKQVAEAKKLAGAGKVAEALAVYDKLVAAAEDGRSRFQIRLGQAEMCRKAGNTPVAQALYQALDDELTALHLERWEPGLVVECLVGYLACLRANRKKGEESPEEIALYRRLAQLQPSLAVELGA